jgi:large subunit ribosomal protein L22
MGVRKRKRAEQIKEDRSQMAFAKLNGCPSSPRKMRLVADLIRGKSAVEALQILKFNSKHASSSMEKLLLSAIDNWQQKNEDKDVENAGLFVSELRVDQGGMLKRLRPRAQGRANRIRKRMNHVTLILGAKDNSAND